MSWKKASEQLEIMAKENGIELSPAEGGSSRLSCWVLGEPPESVRGLIIVILKSETSGNFEHYGDPVIVNHWGHKLKTTVDPIRIELSDVAKWQPWPPNDRSQVTGPESE